MASEGTHEALEKLSPATLERHRAIVSIMEELEAIDWYQQRADVTTNDELKARIIDVWKNRADRYSELRSAEPGRRRLEMSYIGG